MKSLLRPHLLLWLLVPVLSMVLFPFVRENEQLFKLIDGALSINVLLFSIVVHEVAHGWVAYKNGDDTAFKQGRLTLNLIPHVSIFGSIILPVLLYVTNASFMIGWAKPVPFEPVNLNRYPRDIAALALAGPMSNYIMVAIAFILLLVAKILVHFFFPSWAGIPLLQLSDAVETIPSGAFAGVGYTILKTLAHMFLVNAVLGTFNLIPFPPLDGFWVFKSILPKFFLSAVTKVQQFGFILVIIAVNMGLLEVFLYPALMMILVASSLLGVTL